MQQLTSHNLLTLLGQTIRWEAPGARRTYSGIARISGIVATHQPIISETIEGDMLSAAHINDKLFAPHNGIDLRIVYMEDYASITFEIVKP